MKIIEIKNVCGTRPLFVLRVDSKTGLPVDPRYGWFDCNGHPCKQTPAATGK